MTEYNHEYHREVRDISEAIANKTMSEIKNAVAFAVAKHGELDHVGALAVSCTIVGHLLLKKGIELGIARDRQAYHGGRYEPLSEGTLATITDEINRVINRFAEKTITSGRLCDDN